MREIRRFVAGLPLDVAADAWLLLDQRLAASQQTLECHSQVPPSDRNLTAWTTGVELTTVDK